VKIPEWEQVLSAGAAAMNLVTAAHALGYAANWITEWYAYDRRVLDALGLGPTEKIDADVPIARPRLGRPARQADHRPVVLFEKPLDDIAPDHPEGADDDGLFALCHRCSHDAPTIVGPARRAVRLFPRGPEKALLPS